MYETKEIWKNIDGFENYQVSNLGNVRSLERIENVYNYKRKGIATRKRKGKILSQRVSSKGYANISLFKNNKMRTYSIHRLVAEAFIPNEDNKTQINHINGIKLDNRVENLEWCTPRENIRHAFRTGLNKPRKRGV